MIQPPAGTGDEVGAPAAQLVQAAVFGAVAFGLFTSMDQALVGAMTGIGAARGRHTVRGGTLHAIGRGWVLGPIAGIAAAYLLGRFVTAATATPHLLVAS